MRLLNTIHSKMALSPAKVQKNSIYGIANIWNVGMSWCVSGDGDGDGGGGGDAGGD